MASGVSVRPDCVTEFDVLKLNKTHRYIIYSMNRDLTEIGIEEQGHRDSSYTDFQQAIKRNAGGDKCRYGVFDYEFTVLNQHRNKLVFILWAPDTATVRQKMLYSSSKSALIKKLNGVGKEMQATDDSELAEAAVLEKCLDKARS